MDFKRRTLMQIADIICGNFKQDESFFRYRSSSYLTEFFQDCDTDYEHDGSTRNYWVGRHSQNNSQRTAARRHNSARDVFTCDSHVNGSVRRVK